MKVKEESEKVGLKLNIQKTKIMASGPITSWQIVGKTVDTVADFFWAPKSLQMVIQFSSVQFSSVAQSCPTLCDPGSIPGSGRSPGEGNGNPFQNSCLENPMDGGAWWAPVHGVSRSRTRLSDFTFTFHFHALEEEMATHSSVLAWRIPGMGAWWAAVYGVAELDTTDMT